MLLTFLNLFSYLGSTWTSGCYWPHWTTWTSWKTSKWSASEALNCILQDDFNQVSKFIPNLNLSSNYRYIKHALGSARSHIRWFQRIPLFLRWSNISPDGPKWNWYYPEQSQNNFNILIVYRKGDYRFAKCMYMKNAKAGKKQYWTTEPSLLSLLCTNLISNQCHETLAFRGRGKPWSRRWEFLLMGRWPIPQPHTKPCRTVIEAGPVKQESNHLTCLA